MTNVTGLYAPSSHQLSRLVSIRILSIQYGTTNGILQSLWNGLADLSMSWSRSPLPSIAALSLAVAILMSDLVEEIPQGDLPKSQNIGQLHVRPWDVSHSSVAGDGVQEFDMDISHSTVFSDYAAVYKAAVWGNRLTILRCCKHMPAMIEL
jgi:hypothetical protein